MSNKIEDALWQDYEDASQRIDELSIENVESYRIALEDRDKIRNELIKLEQMKNEKENDVRGEYLHKANINEINYNRYFDVYSGNDSTKYEPEKYLLCFHTKERF